jgi:primary-amine oxidase
VSKITHPLDPLSAIEIENASSIVRSYLGFTNEANNSLRFVSVSLLEPPKQDYIAGIKVARQAEIVSLNPMTGIASEYQVDLETSEVVSSVNLPKGVQPLLTPEDCDLAEKIVQTSKQIADIMSDRCGITDMSRIACDPWSVHLASDNDKEKTNWRMEEDGIPGRLVQTFLYHRVYGEGLEDNHYAHPIDIVPVVDLNARKVVTINGLDRPPTKDSNNVSTVS